MQNKLRKILYIIIGLSIIGGIAYAAPDFRIERSIYPETDSTYNFGSSTRRWLGGYFDSIDTTEAQIGTLNISGIAVSPLIVGGSASTTIYGDGTTSTFGGPISAGSLISTGLTNGSVIFSTSSGVLSQDNSNLFWDDVNNRLGIGTTTPAYPLHIQGQILSRTSGSGAPGVIADRTDGKIGSLLAGTAGVGFAYDDTGNFSVRPRTRAQIEAGTYPASTAGITMDTTGNVGVGTATPTFRIEAKAASTDAIRVTNSGFVSGVSGTVMDFYFGNTGNAAGIIQVKDGGGTSGTLLSLNPQGGGVLIPTVYGATTANGTLTLEGTFSATKTTSKVVILPTAGYVGIGTTSPGGKLDIYTGITQTIRLDGSSVIIYSGNFTSERARLYSNGGVGTVNLHDGSAVLKTVLAGSGDSYFNGGNVGIGTTTPTFKFHVSGASSTILLSASSTPTTSTSTCQTGQMSWDDGYIYQCISTNSWKRSTLSAW